MKIVLEQFARTLNSFRRVLDASVVVLYVGLFCIGLGIGLFSLSLALMYFGIVIVAISLTKPPIPPTA